MGTGLEVAAWAAVAVSVGSAVVQHSNAVDSRREQRKARAEQRAQNAAEAAKERRAQYREERVRRARVLQSAANTGVSDSSGEMGAVGGLSTQLSTNIAANLGDIARADSISQHTQNAADAEFRGATAGQIGQLSNSIFSVMSQPNVAASLFKE